MDGERVAAVVVGIALIAQAAQRRIDVGERAGEAHRRVAIGAGEERQAAGRAQRQHAIGDRQVDLLGAAIGIDVGHREAVDDDRGVFGGGLRARRIDHRGVVDRGDVDIDRGVGRQRAAGAGVAQVVDVDGERVAAVVVGIALIGQAAQRRIDVGERAGEAHRRVAIGAGEERQAAGRAQRQHAIGDRQVDLLGAGAGVDVGHRQAVDDDRGVFGGGLRARRIDHRRVVDRVDGQADGRYVAVGGAVIDFVGEAVSTVVIGVRRVVEQTVGVEREARGVRRTGDLDRRQQIMRRVGIGVVEKHATAGVDRQRVVLVDAVGVRVRDRRLVVTADRDVHGRRIGERPVGQRVGEGVITNIVGIGVVAERAKRVERVQE